MATEQPKLKIKIFKGFWTIKDVRKHNKYIFIFGDNDEQYGKGGQAIIRDEPNTHGIPTKKYPDNSSEAFYTDDELERNKRKINAAFKKLKDKINNSDIKYKGIYLPENGLGTGLADLPNCAPKTYEFLEKKINKLISQGAI